MIVRQQINGKWVVWQGEHIVHYADTSEAAWRWVDRYHGEPISPAERRTDYHVEKMLKGE